MTPTGVDFSFILVVQGLAWCDCIAVAYTVIVSQMGLIKIGRIVWQVIKSMSMT